MCSASSAAGLHHRCRYPQPFTLRRPPPQPPPLLALSCAMSSQPRPLPAGTPAAAAVLTELVSLLSRCVGAYRANARARGKNASCRAAAVAGGHASGFGAASQRLAESLACLERRRGSTRRGCPHSPPPPPTASPPALARARRRQQQMLDKTVPHSGLRWCATLAVALLYALRVWSLGGFFIVTCVCTGARVVPCPAPALRRPPSAPPSRPFQVRPGHLHSEPVHRFHHAADGPRQ